MDHSTGVDQQLPAAIRIDAQVDPGTLVLCTVLVMVQLGVSGPLFGRDWFQQFTAKLL